MSQPILNKVRERLLFLSPTVQAGWEPESKKEDFEELKLLGQGAFGVVKKVNHKKTNITYAIKIVEKNMLKKTNMVDQMINEVRIMYSLNHPYILKLYNHFEDDQNIYLVLEFSPGGQLYAFLWKQPSKKFNETTSAKFILELTLALEHIHTRSIIHRDIKPENLLLDDQQNIKLADFGWSNFLKPDEIRSTFCGTLDYLAPEMLDKAHKHNQMVDIWSVGVLLYELLTGISPFAPRDNINNQGYVEKSTRDNIKNVNFKFPSSFPEGAKDLVSKILVKDADKRFDCEQIRKHPWIIEKTKDVKIPASITMELDKKQIVKYSEIESMQKEGKTAFTDNEIYQYSRPDSIIVKDFNLHGDEKVNKMSEILNQKIKTLENKLGELDVDNKKKTAENDNLKQQVELLKSSGAASQEIVNIQHKLKLSDERYNHMKGLYDQQLQKNMELEKKIREMDSQVREVDELKLKLKKYKEEVELYKSRAKKAEESVSKMVADGDNKGSSNDVQQQQQTENLDDYIKKLQNKHNQEFNLDKYK